MSSIPNRNAKLAEALFKVAFASPKRSEALTHVPHEGLSIVNVIPWVNTGGERGKLLVRVPHPTEDGLIGHYALSITKNEKTTDKMWKPYDVYRASAFRQVYHENRRSKWAETPIGERLLYVPLTKALVNLGVPVDFPDGHMPSQEHQELITRPQLEA